jgi:hypothetical protein
VGITTPGEELRRAVRWIAGRLEEDADLPLLPLVEEATRRFDLTPRQSEDLIAFYREGQRTGGR